ncbi:MAG TPA: amino acid ABC transporter substrate-binding protein [Candidatus Scybalocola faecipullorum]|nr:amino acid ABC transporter substrate-binding protein [Candidatus Scybalocola faecipullorum]
MRRLGKVFKQMAIFAALIIAAAGYGYFLAKDAVAEAEGQKIETSGSIGSETDSDGEYFKGEIPVVAISSDYSPYAYYNDQDSVDGADIDILKEILVEDGTDVMKIEDMSFGQLSTALDSGKADIAAVGITQTQERDQVMDFSDVYASAQIVIVMPENSTMTSVDEMDGSGVFGVLQNSLAQTSCEEHGYETLIYEDRESMWRDLATGLLDGAADDCIWVQQYMDIYGGYKILDGILAAEDYVFAVSESNQELLAKINAGIKRLKDTGRIDEIIEEHVGLGLQKHMM